jgi:16S rRNA (adenine1518-N6/adenine1519-N6)-dimethyltransferase
MTAQTRSEIVDLLARHGLVPIHRLGQHFLADANVTRKIVRLSGVGPGSRAVEVGAGTGTLTKALAGAGSRVVAYEIDSGLLPVLEEVTAGLDVEIRSGDVTDVDFATALDGDGWAMVANLPYNVGTPVVLEAIQKAPNIDRYVVMLQSEVARRFVARPGDDDYGLPSVIAGLYTDAGIAFHVPPQVFYPQPRVGSSVLVMTRKEAPPRASSAVELARAGFGHRRKMLRKSLSGVLDAPIPVLSAVGIDATARAEDLTTDDWLRLADSL